MNNFIDCYIRMYNNYSIKYSIINSSALLFSVV